MDNTVDIKGPIARGTLISVARFLVNTSRVLQAIELCKECLILLNSTVQEEVLIELAYASIYFVLIKAYLLLNDHTSGIECTRKLLDISRDLGLKAAEGTVTSLLANIFEVQSNYREAKRLYKKSMSIAIEAGDKQGEAMCYGKLGTVYKSLGKYGKAEEYTKKALAATTERVKPSAVNTWERCTSAWVSMEKLKNIK